MRFEVQDRIMSFSYERDAKEHIQVMRMAGRRMAGGRYSVGAGSFVTWFLVYTVGLGLLLELYRHYVLTFIASLDSIPPFSIAMLQVLPVFALIWALLWLHSRANNRRALKAWEQRLAAKRIVDFDIYPDGLLVGIREGKWSQVPWTLIRDILVHPGLIEFEDESTSFYLPLRAFDGDQDYQKRSGEIYLLWKSTVEAKTRASAEAVGS